MLRRLLRKVILPLLLLGAGVILLPSGSSEAQIFSGSTNCPSSGAKALGAAKAAQWVDIQAPLGNAGTIYYGSLTVTSTTGNFLLPGGAGRVNASGSGSIVLSGIGIACSNSADSVTFNYVQ